MSSNNCHLNGLDTCEPRDVEKTVGRGKYGAAHVIATDKKIAKWVMLYIENDLPKQELRRRTNNTIAYCSPNHACSVFVIKREWFLALRAYDV